MKSPLQVRDLHAATALLCLFLLVLFSPLLVILGIQVVELIGGLLALGFFLLVILAALVVAIIEGDL